MYDIWMDYIKPALIIIFVFALLIVIVGSGLNVAMRYSCYVTVKDLGYPYSYSFWGGCKILENGKWIPLENWRYFGEP